MISKNKLKQYHQLHTKKFRQKYSLFIVEGLKSVEELLNSRYAVEYILCTDESFVGRFESSGVPVGLITDAEMLKLSSQSSPQGILAVVKQKPAVEVRESWSLALDRINDPGNLGTIIRIADWYNIKNIYCSPDTVDQYNPKCIQASMGSFLRVQLHYIDLSTKLKGKKIFATILNGQNVRDLPKQDGGIILIGNEANGIDPELLKKLAHIPVSIPSLSETESLNAAIAAAIFCERLLF